MEKKNITVNVKDGTSMRVYVTQPGGAGPLPGVIVWQEAFGVNNHIRNVADRIAEQGYIVIAPELFHRTAGDGFEGDYNNFDALKPHFMGLTVDGLKADIEAAFTWLVNENNVVKGKIGSIGFCMGGRVAYLANASQPFSACISYYGSNIHSMSDLAKSLSGPHLFFWGGKDKHILPEHVMTVEEFMKESGKPYINVVISYADHAFNSDERPNYNPKAASEAWAMSMAFLKNNLKS